MFKNFFSKKKEPAYDSTNIKITDLELGFVFDYNLSTWKVEEAYTYDWGNNVFSREYKINNGKEQLFLSVDTEDDLELTLSKRIRLGQIQEDILNTIGKKRETPSELHFENETYHFEEKAPGFWQETGNKEWEELESFEYYNEDGSKVLTIEQWDDDEFEASIGSHIKPFEISNILPA